MGLELLLKLLALLRLLGGQHVHHTLKRGLCSLVGVKLQLPEESLRSGGRALLDGSKARADRIEGPRQHGHKPRHTKSAGGGPPRFGGIVYTESARKVAYFIETMNRHRTPLLFVQDVSGFMVGPDAEHSGIIRAGAEFVEAMATATVPKLVLTLNHASGAGYYAMAGQGFDPDFILSLPTGRMGVMEGESAVMALFSSQIDRLKAEGQGPRRGPHHPHGRGPRRVRSAARRPLRRRPRLRGRGGAPRGDCAPALGLLLRAALSNPGPHLGAFHIPEGGGGTAAAIVRLGGGQGFWGDDLEAPVRLVEGGPLDYLMLDYLAEVTMSILRKQRDRDPSAGYARDFVTLMGRIWPTCVERDIRVVANAGGVNPQGCADALVEAGREAGVAGQARVGPGAGRRPHGPRLDELLAPGHELAHLETGEPLSTIRGPRAERQRLHGRRAGGGGAARGAPTWWSRAGWPIRRWRRRRSSTSSAGPWTTTTAWRRPCWRATSWSAAPSPPAGTAWPSGGASPTWTWWASRSSRSSPPVRSR